MDFSQVKFVSPQLVAGVIAGLVALLGAWWLWWRLPKREVERLRPMIFNSAARANAEDNIRKTIGQLLGGAAVLIGAALAYLQFTQQQQASRDLFISNQVSKGFEQLGNRETVVARLGGIYALEGVMNICEQYHRLDAQSPAHLTNWAPKGSQRPTSPPLPAKPR